MSHLTMSRCLSFALIACLVIASVSTPTEAGGCNTAPVAVNDTTDHFGQVTLFDATANDFDADGDPLTLTLVSETCPGTVTVEDGQLLLTPATPGVPRNCSATYRISDGTANSTAIVSYTLQESLLFADDFESGSTGAWSSCTGC